MLTGIEANRIDGQPLDRLEHPDHDGDRRQDQGGHSEIVKPAARADDPLLHSGQEPRSDPAYQADEAQRLEPGQTPLRSDRPR